MVLAVGRGGDDIQWIFLCAISEIWAIRVRRDCGGGGYCCSCVNDDHHGNSLNRVVTLADFITAQTSWVGIDDGGPKDWTNDHPTDRVLRIARRLICSNWWWWWWCDNIKGSANVALLAGRVLFLSSSLRCFVVQFPLDTSWTATVEQKLWRKDIEM